MKAAKAHNSPPKRAAHAIGCAEEGCESMVRGFGANALKAKHDATRHAREGGWDLLRHNVWRCPACRSAFVRADSERRVLLRADVAKEEAKRIREAKRAVDTRRATRPVGAETAKADVTMNSETQRLIHGSNFDRYVYGKLDPTQRKAADHFAAITEKAAGVSDREMYQERVDSQAAQFEPNASQIDAVREMKTARDSIGKYSFAIVDQAITEDMIPSKIGARFKELTTDRDRALVGMALIRAGLNQLADHWRMR